MDEYSIIGMDETGVGDYYTSLVCAAVFVNKTNISKLKTLGIKDSKKLSDKAIQYLAIKIKEITKYQIRHLTPGGYNSLNNIFKNAHILKTFLHWNALDALVASIKNIKVDKIILDAYVDQKNIDKYLTIIRNTSLGFPKRNFNVVLEQKADNKYIAVAAASIIARDFMLKKLVEQQNKWKIKFPLGCNNQTILIGKQFIKQYGVDDLKKVGKISFSTTKKIIK